MNFQESEVKRLLQVVATPQDSPSISSTYELAALMQETGDVLQFFCALRSLGDLSGFDTKELLAFHGRFPSRFLNIGGGPNFLYPLWVNLDAVESVLNPHSFIFSKEGRLPFEDAAFNLVYSSHALEHLDTETVENVLREARRVLHGKGVLLIKIPDFSALLEAWKKGDESLVEESLWNFSSIIPTLKNRGLTDSIHVRTAYIFCGFWNKPFGNIFEQYDVNAAGAYNGPAPMDIDDLKHILGSGSPNRIAAKMREHVMTCESDYTFNHQNAWSHEEFASLLESTGFEVVSMDKEKIAPRYNYVPRILEMYTISSYFIAFPK